MRVDPSDGLVYRQHDFVHFYGSTSQWDAALPLNGPVGLNVDDIRQGLRLQSAAVGDTCSGGGKADKKAALPGEEAEKEEGVYEVLEEEFVLSDEWALHFSRPSGVVSKVQTGKQRGGGTTGATKSADKTSKKSSTKKNAKPGKRDCAAESAGAGLPNASAAFEPVPRWKSVRYCDDYLGAVRQLERQVRSLNGRDTQWKMYPQVAMVP